VPHKVICLATLIAIQALHDDAFEAGFPSFDELLRRPILDGTDRVELKWKTSIRDCQILPLPYHTFLELWNRTLIVLGCKDLRRPYSLRVGAGSLLDGRTSPRRLIHKHYRPSLGTRMRLFT
jgi:hypothetical protein